MTGHEIIAWVDRCAPPHWRGRGSARHDAAWRRIAAWLLYNHAGWSMPMIAKAINRDESSIFVALKLIDAAGPEVAAELRRVLGIARGNVVSIERMRA